ncbi:alanine racemase [Pseudopontixanthobacter vadosimaris]|uniref:alanine racemase n=1 Tax=Pseudopontixanthobacter vadosimaris TaxID=2726450 RepID=UPI00147573F8|nr:alanine racemase [Pseudopontixanthobacter vadosimaris]
MNDIAPPPATLRVNLDSDALAANWHQLDRMSAPGRAGAAVKADCYGLGVDRCVPVLRGAGARDFFVAHWSEVADVVRYVPASDISVLHGLISRTETDYARAVGARPVINSLDQAKLWAEAGGGACDVMVDTGINRLGLAMRDLSDPLIATLDVVTLLSHLASADEASPSNRRQLKLFREARAMVKAKRYSLANSAGIVLGPDYTFDLTRPGLALYGGIPRPELTDDIRQVAYPQAALLLRRDLEPGDRVGYNGTYIADRALPSGIVSIGYADGFLRSRGGEALTHEGRVLPLIGKVSMDMIVLDLTNAPDLREGDWLDIPFDMPGAAQRCGLSQYELLTVIGHRLR